MRRAKSTERQARSVPSSNLKHAIKCKPIVTAGALLGVAYVLLGCGTSEEGSDTIRPDVICADHGGLHSVEIDYSKIEYVICRDGHGEDVR